MIESKLFDKYDSMKAFIFTVGNENLLVKDCDRKTEDGTFDWVCGIKFYIHTDRERKCVCVCVDDFSLWNFLGLDGS